MAYNEKYIASSVFVNAPTGTIGSFGNGIPFSPLANEATQVYNQFVAGFSGDYYLTQQLDLVTITAPSSGNMYLPVEPQSWADITISNFCNEAQSLLSASGNINYLGSNLGTSVEIPANTSVRFVRNESGEWVMIPVASNYIRNAVVSLSSADILALGTKIIVPGVSGVAFEPLSFSWKTDFVTAAYDVSAMTSLDLVYDTISYFTDSVMAPLTAVSDSTYLFAKNTGLTDSFTFSVNKSIDLVAIGGSPASGDSTAVVEVMYKIHTFA
jgi:hypothetical protein